MGDNKGLTDKQRLAKEKREQAKQDKKDQAILMKTSKELVALASKTMVSVEPGACLGQNAKVSAIHREMQGSHGPGTGEGIGGEDRVGKNHC